MINLVTGVAGFPSCFPCPYCSSRIKAWPTACLRTTGGNLDHFRLWQQTSSKLSEKKMFLNCSHVSVPHSLQPVLYLTLPPPLHLKLSLTNQLMHLLYTIDPSYEEMLEQLLDEVRKAYHKKFFEGRHCTKILRSAERIKAMLPSSCAMILQTLDALNNDCSAAFERQLGGE